MQRHWDIFCRVIDNYGDIGVCWRLARQLRTEYNFRVRLWVDDLVSLAALCPLVNPQLSTQVAEGVEIHVWASPFPEVEAADVVIEAFACDLPSVYLEAMAAKKMAPRWINLEYLSAESWVEDCHCMASPHPTLPLVKHFFFPGFTSRTGGLLREKGLLEKRNSFPGNTVEHPPLKTSLFCYDSAPVGELLEAWAVGDIPIRCHVPPGKPQDAIHRYFGKRDYWRQGNLEVVPIPFVPQADFDRLLWQCDVNFVRGEDSFVRAQWAGKPFVWHIYPQDDAAHLTKLNAFLAVYVKGQPEPAASAIQDMFHAWNRGSGVSTAWRTFLDQQPVLSRHAHQWADWLATQNDLADNLIKFCGDKL